MKLRFLCVGGFTCSTRSTLQNVKHEPSRGSGGMPPRKFLKMHALRLRFNLVLFEAQNCYAKDRLWKSAVRKFHWQCMLIRHQDCHGNLDSSRRSDSCASSVIFASCLFPRQQSLFSFTGWVLVLLPLSCVHTWCLRYKKIFCMCLIIR